MSGPDAVLEVRLRKRVHAGLDLNVSFRLGRERGLLFGPSGAGKSTILRLIAGLERPDEGLIRLGGSTLFDSSAKVATPLRSRQVGLIFQDDLLFPHLSVAANVRFGLQGWPRLQADRRLAEVGRLCGIEPLMARRPATLSGGERQRVGLARALAPRPRLLLCDEPVSALDVEARHAILDRLRLVQERESVPILHVTHAIDEAIAFGSRLFLLRGGRIEAEGDPLHVLASAGFDRWPSLRNSFPGSIEGHDGPGGACWVRLDDGPRLVVPAFEGRGGTRVVVDVRSDDVVLALGPIGPLSARNLVEGTVAEVVGHGREAEVIIKTGGIAWVVGVVGSAVESLGLRPGLELRMIIKARSCRVVEV